MEFYRIGPPRVAGGNASAAGSSAPKPRCGAGRAASMVLYRSGDFCHHQPVDADDRKERGMRDADWLHETSDPWRLMMSDPDMKNAEHIEQQPGARPYREHSQ
jgi:hypothetical protein